MSIAAAWPHVCSIPLIAAVAVFGRPDEPPYAPLARLEALRLYISVWVGARPSRQAGGLTPSVAKPWPATTAEVEPLGRIRILNSRKMELLHTVAAAGRGGPGR